VLLFQVVNKTNMTVLLINTIILDDGIKEIYLPLLKQYMYF